MATVRAPRCTSAMSQDDRGALVKERKEGGDRLPQFRIQSELRSPGGTVLPRLCSPRLLFAFAKRARIQEEEIRIPAIGCRRDGNVSRASRWST
jgi:hypothetical protein